MARRLPRVRGGRTSSSGEGIGKRFLRALGRELLGEFGLGADHFKPGGFVHGKLGLYSQAVKKTAVDKGPELPALIKPKTAPNVSNPSISSIAKQLSALVKISKAIGLMTKKQQEALVKQITQADRAAKENALESGANAELVQNNLTGGENIQPVNDALLELAEQLSKLTDAVREKVNNQGGGILDTIAGAASLLPGSRGGARAVSRVTGAVRSPRLNRGFTSFVDHAGTTRFRSSLTGRYASRAEAVKAPLLQRAGRALASTALSSRVGGLMSSSLRTAAAKGGAVRVASAALIKRLAGPIVAKGLGRTVLKSIPVIGAVAGLGFAAKRLLEGDPVGAGLDAVSGLAGPMTAIPAFIASVARDIYTQVFGVHPEEDPNAGARLAMVTDAVKSLVEETLRPRLTPRTRPGQATPLMGPSAPPAPPPAQRESGQSMTSPQTVPAPPRDSGGAPASSTPSGGGGGSPSSPPASSSPSGGGGGSPGAASSGGAVTPKPETANYSKPEDAEKVAPSPSVGAGIVELTQENAAIETNNLVPKINIFGVDVPMPSFTPTTRNGARGMGNVPDPNYSNYHPDLPAQLYFSAVV